MDTAESGKHLLRNWNDEGEVANLCLSIDELDVQVARRAKRSSGCKMTGLQGETQARRRSSG